MSGNGDDRKDRTAVSQWAENDLDHMRGVVTVKDIFMQIVNNKEIDLSTIKKQALFVPETMHALELVETFKKNKTHFGLVEINMDCSKAL